VNSPGNLDLDKRKTKLAGWFLSATRVFASLLVFALGVFFSGFGTARAAVPAQIHWTSVTQAQVKIDQTTPLTWAVYQPGRGDKLDKKLSNLVLALVGHRYLLMDLKAKQVYEVPLKQVHVQGDACETDDLAESSNLIPTSDWTWRNVGPAELYHFTLGDYGLPLQLTLPHPYLISPYY
jgi:hypothetical protein